ncbi:hypothetical protein [Oceanicola granulosus]|uniref:hypothetical protein n=1 Tax=Oceanicola granulosus TaxID=252302 RepID=UPI0012EA2976|nr:hypothetical protein [Oceanicola granulosus]
MRHLADLQWDYLRHRRLRDARLKRQVATKAAAMLDGPGESFLDLGIVSPEYEEIGRALVGPDESARQDAQDQIAAAGLSIEDAPGRRPVSGGVGVGRVGPGQALAARAEGARPPPAPGREPAATGFLALVQAASLGAA